MKTRAGARIGAGVIAIVAFLLPIGVRAQTQPDAKLQTLTPEPIEPAGLNPAVGAFDVLVVRPLAAAALPVGLAFFVPAALLAAPGGRDSVEQALEIFVLTPGRYVFTRPLGEF